MELSRTTLNRVLKETAEDLFQRASHLEVSLKHSSMSVEAERLWFGVSRREQINHLRVTGRQLLRRLSY
jgi:hypothetical protein